MADEEEKRQGGREQGLTSVGHERRHAFHPRQGVVVRSLISSRARRSLNALVYGVIHVVFHRQVGHGDFIWSHTVTRSSNLTQRDDWSYEVKNRRQGGDRETWKEWFYIRSCETIRAIAFDNKVAPMEIQGLISRTTPT